MRRMSDAPTPAHLRATPAIDADHPDVQAFARQHAQGANERERAVALTHAVRDGFRYDPYRIDLSPAGMRASTVLANGYGWCVPKATLLTAVARAAGIPARLGFADVRNHLSNFVRGDGLLDDEERRMLHALLRARTPVLPLLITRGGLNLETAVDRSLSLGNPHEC